MIVGIVYTSLAILYTIYITFNDATTNLNIHTHTLKENYLLHLLDYKFIDQVSISDTEIVFKVKHKSNMQQPMTRTVVF